jgi:hypothetical protein
MILRMKGKLEREEREEKEERTDQIEAEAVPTHIESKEYTIKRSSVSICAFEKVSFDTTQNLTFSWTERKTDRIKHPNRSFYAVPQHDRHRSPRVEANRIQHLRMRRSSTGDEQVQLEELKLEDSGVEADEGRLGGLEGDRG